METKINIAEILKDKPINTKLYSPAYGSCLLVYPEDYAIRTKSNKSLYFYDDGRLDISGETMLFPSKKMRDWSKFAWKKGDVLQNNDHSTQVIFDKFISNTYEIVRCKYWLKVDNGIERFVVETNVFTKDYFKVSEELSQCYINEIENRLGGKLNLETLEIEKQTKFKDGDIVVYGKSVAICRRIYKHTLSFYVSLNEMVGLLFADEVESSEEYRFATDEDKQQLFDALAKEGKAWDAGKKEVVDLKPKVELKPFDKVLCRNSKDDTWEADFFARLTRKEIDYTQSGKYLCVGDLWMYCIPYNEETAHLLGTTDEWKGGEQ